VTKGVLTQISYVLGGANSSTSAYFSGGYSTNAYIATTNGLTFATDTAAQVTKGPLSQAKGWTTGAQSGSY
jgi:hypothetical protein